MPLKKGASNKTRSENIAQERRSGRPLDQAIAIAYSQQRKAKGQKPRKGKK